MTLDAGLAPSQALALAPPPLPPLPAPAPGPASEYDFTWTAGKASEARGAGMGVAAPSVPQLTCVRKAPPRQSSREARCTTTQPAPSRAARRRPPQIILSLFLFLAAGVAEIGGGWLVWQSIRLHKGWYLAVAGAAVLFVYGVIPCAQPMDNFGRVRACVGCV